MFKLTIFMVIDSVSPSNKRRQRLRIIARPMRAPVSHTVIGREYERGLVIVRVVLVKYLIDLFDNLVYQNYVRNVIPEKKEGSVFFFPSLNLQSA